MKKALKPIILIASMIIVAIVAVILYDKFTGKPEEAVKGVLNGLKTNDVSMVNKYSNYNELLTFNDGDTNSTENNIIDSNNDNIKMILSNLSYEIMNTRVENNEAHITVSITNMDLKDIFSQYFGQYIKIAFASGFSSDEQAKENNVDTESIKQTMDQYLKSLLNKEDKQMATNTVDITVKKQNGDWKVEPSSELKNAILPGINSVGEYLENMNKTLND